MASKAQMEATMARLEAQLAHLTGKPAATAVPGWTAGPPPAAYPVKVKAPSGPRSWTRKGAGISQSGNPYTVFSAPMRNGGAFDMKVPDDLVAAIRAGI